MTNSELEQLLASLRAGGPDLAAAPAKARADFAAMTAAAPVAVDVQFESLRLDQVPALTSVTGAARLDHTLLYLHGGAYVIGSSHDYRSLSAELGRAVGVRCVSVDYRLAPEHPFPAAVEDALAAYRALLAQGTRAADIVLAGDSAGGGVVMSLLLAARAAGLQMPAGALLISPWIDLSCSGGTMHSKVAEDPVIRREALLIMAKRYLSETPRTAELLNPLEADLTGLPPMLLQVGSAEVLLDDSLRLAAALARAGVRVQLSVWPQMPHVWHFFHFMLEEGRRAIREAGDFLRGQLET